MISVGLKQKSQIHTILYVCRDFMVLPLFYDTSVFVRDRVMEVQHLQSSFYHVI